MPLRISRSVTALIAAVTVVIWIGASALPAAASVRQSEWWLRNMGISSAWGESQGAGVTVAVLSDGIDASRAGVSGAMTVAPAADLPGAPTATTPYFGAQGTAIASLIAGHGNGVSARQGVLGVAPAANILSVPVTLAPDDPELGLVAPTIPAAIATGIRYAVNHGASVIDLPIDPGQPDSTGSGGVTAAAGGSPAEQLAVRYALAHNVVLVAPAGDDGASTDAPNYPAAYPGVIAVGAFNQEFVKAPWSSHQSYVTVTAAGAGVIAAANTGDYQTVNSTSAASAVVAGVVALLRARYPNLSVPQVRQALIASTMFRHADGLTDGSGYGAVNADKALAAAAKLALPATGRADAGAQPFAPPGTVAAAASGPGLGSQLARAAEISAALLLILLLGIACYVAIGRRRRSAQPAVPADWSRRQAQSRYPSARAAEADSMLEIFTAPVAPPDGISGPTAPGLQSDSGLFAAPAEHAGAAVGQEPGFRMIGSGAAATSVASEPDSWQSHGPASQAVSRRPAVSGAPPWEPAALPAGELPWTISPAGQPAGPEQQSAEGEQTVQGGHHVQGGHDAPPDEHGRAAVKPASAADRSPFRRGGEPRHASRPAADRLTRPREPRLAAPAVPAIPARPTGATGATGPAAWNPPGETSARSRTTESGLPVRTPRQFNPAPLSPSGSLWEPVEREPADDADNGQEPSAQPIFVWNPPRSADSPPPGDPEPGRPGASWSWQEQP